MAEDQTGSEEQIEQKATDALRVIYRRGMVRGKDLKRLAEIADNAQLTKVLRNLESRKLVTVKRACGGESDDASLEAFVAPLPSGRAQGEYAIQQAT